MQIQKQKLVWILEDSAGSQFVYQEILDMRFSTRYFSNLSEFQLAWIDSASPRPDLLIADIRLPDGSFLTFLQAHPEVADQMIVLVVSSLDDLDILRHSFSLGAKDFLTKPFRRNELLVKIERLLEAPAPSTERKLDAENKIPSIVLDTLSMRIRRGDIESAALTAKEFQLLTALIRANQKTVSRMELNHLIWPGLIVEQKSLDVHLSHLRKKLELVQVLILFKEPGHYSLSASIQLN